MLGSDVQLYLVWGWRLVNHVKKKVEVTVKYLSVQTVRVSFYTIWLLFLFEIVWIILLKLKGRIFKWLVSLSKLMLEDSVQICRNSASGLLWVFAAKCSNPKAVASRLWLLISRSAECLQILHILWLVPLVGNSRKLTVDAKHARGILSDVHLCSFCREYLWQSLLLPHWHLWRLRSVGRMVQHLRNQCFLDGDVHDIFLNYLADYVPDGSLTYYLVYVVRLRVFLRIFRVFIIRVRSVAFVRYYVPVSFSYKKDKQNR